MTDKQILDVVIKRIAKVAKQYDASLSNPKICFFHQYAKKLMFCVKFNNSTTPYLIRFRKNSTSIVFMLPELPGEDLEWKRNVIKQLVNSNNTQLVEYDLEHTPKSIIHIFSSAMISALNSPTMSVDIGINNCLPIFNANETYEEVSIEADMDTFDDGLGF